VSLFFVFNISLSVDFPYSIFYLIYIIYIYVCGLNHFLFSFFTFSLFPLEFVSLSLSPSISPSHISVFYAACIAGREFINHLHINIFVPSRNIR
jgi:hypothetical protein